MWFWQYRHYMDILLPLWAQISLIFALWHAVLKKTPIFACGSSLWNHFQIVIVDMLTGVYCSPECPNFHPFRSTASRFRVTVNFSFGGGRCGGATMVKVGNGQSTHVDRYLLLPSGPNFCPFRSTGSRFRVTVNFSIGGRNCGGATTVKPMF